jgi:uncharacterized RDD family membrane protein YckC
MYKSTSSEYAPASFWRRLGALFYDVLASLALLMFASALWLPFYGGHAVPPGNHWYQASLIGVLYLYFGYSWHKGQTLGMRAWRLYITDLSGKPVSFRQTILRFLTAPLNLFYDKWSGTIIYWRKP